MIRLSFLFIFTLPLFAVSADRTVVLYNALSPGSKEVAMHYQKARGIKESHMIGLRLPKQGVIPISRYEKALEEPLKALLDKRKLWSRSAAGQVQSAEFDVIVTCYEVPYKTLNSKVPDGVDEEGKPKFRNRKMKQADGASVDSELTLLAQPKYPRIQAIPNPYFKKKMGEGATRKPLIFLVGRIDGPSVGVCLRMIDDAVSTEQEGLYGYCYVDKSLKPQGYGQGDAWLEKLVKATVNAGMPAVVENTKDVFVTNYPMQDAALYYGWYRPGVCGPFLHPEFKFKRGAVATHIHSFSAERLRNPKKRWCGPLLERGAAACLGNVAEPFLHLTTHLDLFHEELLAGRSLGESAWAATPMLSWQNVVLGDPLYRPFKKAHPGNGDLKELVKAAPLTEASLERLEDKAEGRKSAVLHEVVGLLHMRLSSHEKCILHFSKAQKLSDSIGGKVRNIHHQIAYYRSQGLPEKALSVVKAYYAEYKDSPEGKSLVAIKNILAPPPPPPVKAQQR